MGRNLSALIAGLVFGLGLTFSEMVNPAKVLSFLDILGDWDPSLAFVMGAALLVTAIGYRIVWRAERPVFATEFQVPGNRSIDARLATGAILLSFGGPPIFIFMASMAAGMGLFELFNQMSKERTAA